MKKPASPTKSTANHDHPELHVVRSEEVFVVWGQYSDRSNIPAFLRAFDCLACAEEYWKEVLKAEPVMTVNINAITLTRR